MTAVKKIYIVSTKNTEEKENWFPKYGLCLISYVVIKTSEIFNFIAWNTGYQPLQVAIKTIQQWLFLTKVTDDKSLNQNCSATSGFW